MDTAAIGAVVEGMVSLMKRLLAISWCMPPLLAPRSIQVARTLKCLGRQHGWEIDVVTAGGTTTLGRMDHDLDSIYGDGYRVIEVGESSGLLGVNSHPLVSRVLSRFPLTDRRQWGRAAFSSALGLAREKKYDVIVSFAQPWIDHLVGLRLKREAGLPWVVHCSDPWSDNPFESALSKRLWRGLERAVINEADAVVFVAQETLDLTMRKYTEQATERAHVVPHGFDPSLRVSPETQHRGEHMRLAYVGNFYGPRSPRWFLEALGSLVDENDHGDLIRVLFAGGARRWHRDSVIRSGLADCVRFAGRISYMESIEEAAKADLLLLIDAPSAQESMFLPSKLVDYMLARKPILGMTPLRGASAALVGRLGCPVVAPNDVEGIRDELERAVGLWCKEDLVVPREFDGVAAEYRIGHTAGMLNEVLNGVLNT